jgi:hypothetical protein
MCPGYDIKILIKKLNYYYKILSIKIGILIDKITDKKYKNNIYKINILIPTYIIFYLLL